jgi:cell division protein ZapA (FtsZ GTPase activity inhibitor)
MSKNKIKLTICGVSCSILSDDTEEYVQSVGREVEAAIEAVTSKNERASLTLAAIITALNFCDTSHKALDAADNLRSQIKDYLEDSSKARLEVDEARREIEKMKKEIQTLRARLDEREGTPHTPPAAAPAAAPLQRPDGQPSGVQKGSFSNPLKPSITPEQEGFMSFFEKKE